MGGTLFDKIWDAHVILENEGGEALLYVDRHLTHDLHFRSFDTLESRGVGLKEPDKLYAMPDHSVPTTARRLDEIADAGMREAVEALQRRAVELGFVHFGMEDDRRGIVHVVGPELGITLPGLLLVCGDSHTSTHGALGCLAFGIGSTEIEHVMATQTIWQRRPKTMRLTIDGKLAQGVSGKDIILAVIRELGSAGGTGHAIEYAGEAIESLSVEGRMTVCNMTIEAGARFGLIAPDDKTIAYCRDLPHAPQGENRERAEAYWRGLHSDADAHFDREHRLDVGDLAPMVTWGNNPQWAVSIDETVPDPTAEPDARRRAEIEASLDYMGLTAGQSMRGLAVDTVFIGACTNSRIEDLRAAASIVHGRRAKVRTLVVPGSGRVKRQAEAEGLDRIFTEAGMQWREPGCSMCVAVNGDMLAPGERSASTSNRSFQGRQGPGSRTHLVSPVMAAAAAVSGHLTDARELT